MKLRMAHSKQSVNVSCLPCCSFLSLHIQPSCLPGFAVCTGLSNQTEALSISWNVHGFIPCPNLPMSKFYSALRPSSDAWSSRSCFFVVFFFLPMPGSSVSQPSIYQILLDTAAFHMVLGGLWEYLTSLLRTSTLGESILVSQNDRHRDPSGYACPILINCLEEEMGRGRHPGTKQVEGRGILHLWKGGGMRSGMQQGREWTWSRVNTSTWKEGLSWGLNIWGDGIG